MPIRQPEPLLMVAWDAAEPSLVERWMDEGLLPNLARLRDRGTYGRLGSTADWLAGSVWPTFYTGLPPSKHGIYRTPQWRAGRMRHERPTMDWLPARPFWRCLDDSNVRTVAIDVPKTYAAEPFSGAELAGWAAHDRLCSPTSHPASLAKWVRRKAGSPPAITPPCGLLPAKTLIKLRDKLLALAAHIPRVASAVMRKEQANLYIASLTSTHTAGHRFWDLSGMRGHASDRQAEQLSTALRDIYVASDHALGHLIQAVGEDARVMVFSLHGMGPNESRAELLHTMLKRISGHDTQPHANGRRQRMGQRVPQAFTHAVKRCFSPSASSRRTASGWRGDMDESFDQFVPLGVDLQGYVGINLQGRERDGVVPQGRVFDELCERIAMGLWTFVDADTNEPIVAAIRRGDQLFPDQTSPASLPDLMIQWTSQPVSKHRLIVSPEYGSIPWPTPGKCPDGRSGNHRSEGFLAASGKGVVPGTLKGGHILDLAPTACSLMGVITPWPMAGRPLF